MIPIEQFRIDRRKLESGTEYLRGEFLYRQHSALSNRDVVCQDAQESIKNAMRAKFWNDTYGDLRQPLNELMYLARRVSISHPGTYPEAARIEELTKELNDLLDWRKQSAAKQEKEAK